MSDFVLGQGDTASPLETFLLDDAGNPAEIFGDTITATITPIQGGDPIATDQAVENLQTGANAIDGTKGKVRIGKTPRWTPTQTETAGDYTVRFKATAGDGSVQSFPNRGFLILTIGPTASTLTRYLTRDQLKLTMSLEGESYADADLDVAIEAASRGLEKRYGARWVLGPVDEVRYYTADNCDDVFLGDVLEVTEVAIDYGPSFGGGSFATILAPADYRLLPVGNGISTAPTLGDGTPFRTLQLARGGRYLSLPSGVDAVRITGRFGWERVPAGVTAATTILAQRIFKRMREAPSGFIGLGVDGVTQRMGRIAYDPEITFAMEGAKGAKRLLV